MKLNRRNLLGMFGAMPLIGLPLPSKEKEVIDKNTDVATEASIGDCLSICTESKDVGFAGAFTVCSEQRYVRIVQTSDGGFTVEPYIPGEGL